MGEPFKKEEDGEWWVNVKWVKPPKTYLDLSGEFPIKLGDVGVVAYNNGFWDKRSRPFLHPKTEQSSL